MYKCHYISDSELKIYQLKAKSLDNNKRAKLIYKQQSQHFTMLKQNLEKLKKQKVKRLVIENVDIRLVLNPTRKASIEADTFLNKQKVEICRLCNLPEDQRGFGILDDRYFVIPNPGITMRGDLTITSTRHQTQEISDNFRDMLQIARDLYDYSIYFNGPLAGASIPHLHFQAGLEKQLPGEKQIFSLMNGNYNSIKLLNIIKFENVVLVKVLNFLRECYILSGTDINELSRVFYIFMRKLKVINKNFTPRQHIQNFGEYIPALGKNEDEPRLNIMVNWDNRENRYIIAIFPKRSNRPVVYYDNKNQIMLGMGIKESLGNLITFRQKDFELLKNSPSEITNAYKDTSITKEQSDTLSKMLEDVKI